ncbi:hypothetical protein J6590_090486 [Homalodisca vitripennis]|nr:hypothetical protein J6590_090486 [Homalodisca vitripennis]
MIINCSVKGEGRIFLGCGRDHARGHHPDPVHDHQGHTLHNVVFWLKRREVSCLSGGF